MPETIHLLVVRYLHPEDFPERTVHEEPYTHKRFLRELAEL